MFLLLHLFKKQVIEANPQGLQPNNGVIIIKKETIESCCILETSIIYK